MSGRICQTPYIYATKKKVESWEIPTLGFTPNTMVSQSVRNDGNNQNINIKEINKVNGRF